MLKALTKVHKNQSNERFGLLQMCVGAMQQGQNSIIHTSVRLVCKLKRISVHTDLLELGIKFYFEVRKKEAWFVGKQSAK